MKAKVANLAKTTNIHNKYLIQNFMFEALIKRIAVSNYKENFIIKGGFLLTSLFGVNLRSTMDIDITLKSFPLEKEKILKVINEIIRINIDDNIDMKVEGIKDIRKDDPYSGFSVNIKVEFDNLKTNLMIDITTGDIITYKEIDYQYKTLFENEIINVMAYNLETIIAEKYEAIISRNIDNSRMKDYYDLYMFVNFKWSEINVDILKVAIINTANNRNTIEYIKNSKYYIDAIKDSDELKKLWINYSKNYSYADGINFDELVKAIEKIYKILNL